MGTFGRTYKNEYQSNRWEVRGGEVSKPITRTPHNYWYWLYQTTGSPTPTTFVTGRAYQMGSAAIDQKPGLPSVYDQFWRKASGGAKASLGITLLEWKSSFGMIATQAGSLWQAMRALRRGDVYNCVRLLGARPDHRAKRVKDKYDRGWRLDSLWLELNFGWAPLVDDIGKAVAVLGQEIPTKRVRARGKSILDYNYTYTWPQGRIWDNGLGYIRYEYVGDVISVNANLLLAKQLGLTNPIAVAWDAVPFSFVVDWFLPVNKFLSSFDAELGVSVANLSTSRGCFVSGQQGRVVSDDPSLNFGWMSEFRDFRRQAVGSLPFPGFVDRLPPVTWDLWRAATSVALVVQQLGAIGANARSR